MGKLFSYYQAFYILDFSQGWDEFVAAIVALEILLFGDIENL